VYRVNTDAGQSIRKSNRVGPDDTGVTVDVKS
jgi:hypothetical protein